MSQGNRRDRLHSDSRKNPTGSDSANAPAERHASPRRCSRPGMTVLQSGARGRLVPATAVVAQNFSSRHPEGNGAAPRGSDPTYRGCRPKADRPAPWAAEPRIWLGGASWSQNRSRSAGQRPVVRPAKAVVDPGQILAQPLRCSRCRSRRRKKSLPCPPRPARPPPSVDHSAPPTATLCSATASI